VNHSAQLHNLATHPSLVTIEARQANDTISSLVNSVVLVLKLRHCQPPAASDKSPWRVARALRDFESVGGPSFAGFAKGGFCKKLLNRRLKSANHAAKIQLPVYLPELV
jgi:hypothetical protein